VALPCVKFTNTYNLGHQTLTAGQNATGLCSQWVMVTVQLARNGDTVYVVAAAAVSATTTVAGKSPLPGGS